MTVPRTAALAAVLTCIVVHAAPVRARTPELPTVFVTLPTAKGFTDATHAIVEAQTLVHRSLEEMGGVRVVGAGEQADVVVTVLGRGKGDQELTAALRGIDSSVVAPPVPIGERERYIEVMLALKSCGHLQTAVDPRVPDSCFRRIFVGVGFAELDLPRRAKKPALNSWEACADAVARDIRAWLTTNASQLRALR